MNHINLIFLLINIKLLHFYVNLAFFLLFNLKPINECLFFQNIPIQF